MKKRTEFSKKLAIAVSFLFFFVILFSLATWFFQDRTPIEILGYVATPFGVIVTGYFAKAGVENYSKISQSKSREIEDNRGVDEEWIIKQ